MSWLYSRALVEEFSEATNLDGAQSALLSGSPTPQAFLPSDRMTAFSRPFRFGMTFAPLTVSLGKDVLTWCQAVSRARTYPSPAKAQASPEREADSGDTWRGSLARLDPSTFLWRTAQPSLLEDLGESSVIWPRSGMTAGGQCWALPMLGRRIKGTGSGLWPTPLADDTGIRKLNYAQGGTPLSLAAATWPTPTVCGNYNRKGASTPSGDGLATAVKFATPLARDWRSGKSSQATHDKNSRPLSEQIGGSLNPTWVEWLMGWPLGWTDLKPLATDKFRPAQPPLGES